MEKTCGNCNIADFDLMRCDYFDDNGEHEAITKNKPACEDWIKRVLTDEERYQQLAEVAKDMFTYINDPLDFVERIGEKYILDGHYKWSSIFREQLEELGVEVSDTPKNI